MDADALLSKHRVGFHEADQALTYGGDLLKRRVVLGDVVLEPHADTDSLAERALRRELRKAGAERLTEVESSAPVATRSPFSIRESPACEIIESRATFLCDKPRFSRRVRTRVPISIGVGISTS